MRYCLDSSVLIQAHRNYYSMDIVPGFWNFLEELASEGAIRVPHSVYEEIKDGRDRLYDWLKRVCDRYTILETPDSAVMRAFQQIADFVIKNYEPQHYTEFLNCADPWVVAHSKANGYTVITMEARKQENRRQDTGRIAGKIKLPNICDKFNVPYNDTFWLLRQYNARLKLCTP